MSDHQQSATPTPDGEISLTDIVLVLVRYRRLILMSIILGTLLGLAYAMSLPREYTVTMQMVPEASESRGGTGGLAALRGLGFDFGSVSPGLGPEMYPNLMKSRDVLLAVLYDTMMIGGDSSVLLEYLNRDEPQSIAAQVKRYTLGLPRLAHQAVRTEEKSEKLLQAGSNSLSSDELDGVNLLMSTITVSSERQTGMLRLSVTAAEPYLATRIAESVVRHFTSRMRLMHTEKQHQSLEFIRDRRDQARQDLEDAERVLASFVDRNASLQSARLLVERDRLQRLVSFHADLYSELQRQFSTAEIDLERSRPIISVLESPLPPRLPSGPNRRMIVVLSIFLGGFIGVIGAFLGNLLHNETVDPVEVAKRNEIREAFRWGKRLLKREAD